MSTVEHRLQAPPANARMPRQIPFIIGNEGCERFSFYGMRNILTPFLVGYAAAVSRRKPSAPAAPRRSSTPS